MIVVGLSSARLEAATRVEAAAELPGTMIAELSEGPGADLVIGASGEPEGFVRCTRSVRASGHIAHTGTHGRPAPGSSNLCGART